MTNFLVVCNLYLKNGAIPAEVHRAFKTLLYAAECSKYSEVTFSVAVLASEQAFIQSQIDNHNNVHFTLLPADQQIPTVGDVLSSAFSWLESSKIVIYLNADICVPYYFFDFITANMGMVGPDGGLIVNRKDLLSANLNPFSDSPLVAKPHPGFDCMIFPANKLKQFRFGNVSVGLPPVGALFVVNMLALLNKVILINEPMLTWHEGSGEESSWWTEERRKSVEKNLLESYEALEELLQLECAAKTFVPITHTETYIQGFMSWRSLHKQGVVFPTN